MLEEFLVCDAPVLWFAGAEVGGALSTASTSGGNCHSGFFLRFIIARIRGRAGRFSLAPSLGYDRRGVGDDHEHVELRGQVPCDRRRTSRVSRDTANLKHTLSLECVCLVGGFTPCPGNPAGPALSCR